MKISAGIWSWVACAVLLCFLCACPAAAQVSYCFKSSDKNNLHLRFTLIDKDWEYGYIRYNKPEYGIPIKKVRSTVLMSGGTEIVWEEQGKDTATGIYSFQLEGSAISNMIYIRAKDKEKFLFERTNTGFTDCECNW